MLSLINDWTTLQSASNANMFKHSNEKSLVMQTTRTIITDLFYLLNLKSESFVCSHNKIDDYLFLATSFVFYVPPYVTCKCDFF